MIPNVFISSTIDDLHYLRDALGEAICEIGYRPVMSDRGDVPYIHAGRSEDACFQSVQNCQLVVIIIGQRYGSGTTHKEFLAARAANIPMFTFVESRVLTYWELYKNHPTSDIWVNCGNMEAPEKTFCFLREIDESSSSNGMIAIPPSGEAKNILKKQIAGFVGLRLAEFTQPVRKDIQMLMAEVKTMREQLVTTTGVSPAVVSKGNQFLLATRFLLDDRLAEFRTFLKELAGDLDEGIEALVSSETLDDLVARFGGSVERTSEAYDKRLALERKEGGWPFRFAFDNGSGWYAVYKNNNVLINPEMLISFGSHVERLRKRLAAGEGAGNYTGRPNSVS